MVLDAIADQIASLKRNNISLSSLFTAQMRDVPVTWDTHMPQLSPWSLVISITGLT